MASTTKSKFSLFLDSHSNFAILSVDFRWMEVLLPCDDLYMRSVITQRPSYDCPRHMNLTFTIEKQLSLLLKQEIEYHIYLE